MSQTASSGRRYFRLKQAGSTLKLQSPVNRRAFESYMALDRVSGLPHRDAITADWMTPFQDHVILIDVLSEPDPDFRFRSVGGYFSSFWTGDPTGARLSGISGQGPGSTIWEALSAVVEARQPATSMIPYVGPKKGVYNVEDCLMPFADSEGRVDTVVVTCEYLSRFLRA